MTASPSRIERLFTPLRCLGVLGAFWSFAGLLVLAEVEEPESRAVGVALAAGALSAALGLVAWPGWGWLLILGAFGGTQAAAIGVLPRGTGASARFFFSLFLLLAGGLALQALLGLVRFVSPLKVLLLVLVGCVSLWTIELVLARRPELVAETPRRALNVPSEMQWVGATFMKDPTLEYVRPPNARVLQYYPSDPREYFHSLARPDWFGDFDMRTFALYQHKPCEGSRLFLPPSPRGTLKVVNRCAGDGGGVHAYDAQLIREGIELRVGLTYNFQFRARSTPPSSIDIDLLDQKTMQAGIMTRTTVELDETFRRVMFHVTPTDDFERVKWSILVGHQDSVFEMTDAAIYANGDLSLLETERHLVEMQMNSLGFRDREHKPEAPPGVFRIAVLGDSMTEGWGVHFEDLLTRRLERLLNEKKTGTESFEVMNFGLTGYGSRQERLLYETLVSKLGPDLVIVMVCFNDDMSAVEEAEFLDNARKHREKLPLQILARFDAATNQRKYDPSICVRELTQLAADCETNGARLALALFRQNHGPPWPEMREAIEEAFRGTGVAVIDVGKVLDVEDPNDELIAHAVDRHPGPKAHKLAAEFLHAELTRLGLLAPPARASVSER